MADKYEVVEVNGRKMHRYTSTLAKPSTTAYGKTVPAYNFTWTWDAYPDFASMRDASDDLSEAERLKARNDKSEQKARGEAFTAKMKELGHAKPTEENDPQIALRNMVKTLLTKKNPDGTTKHTQESARALASQLLETEWEE